MKNFRQSDLVSHTVASAACRAFAGVDCSSMPRLLPTFLAHVIYSSLAAKTKAGVINAYTKHGAFVVLRYLGCARYIRG